MRDLAKSLFSFSWASMVFGTKRLLNMVQVQSPSGPAVNAKATGNAACSQATGDFFERTFRAGDTLQRGMVDMMFGVFTPSALNPAWWLKMSTDAMQRSANAFRQASPGTGPTPCSSAGSSTGSGSGSTGWGPVS